MEITIIVIACALQLALGLFVYLRDRNAITSQVFMLLTLSLSVWTIASFLTEFRGADLLVNDVANKFAFIGGYGALITGLLFTYFFPVKRVMKLWEKWLLIGMSLVVFALSTTPLVAGDVTIAADGHLVFSNGPLLVIYIASFLIGLILIGRNLIKLPESFDRRRRRQSRIVLAAFIATAVAGMVFSVLIPLFTHSWSTAKYSPLASVILVSMIVYAIARHGLFDIRLAVVRTATYALSLATLAGTYYLLALLVSQTFLNDSHLVQPAGVVLALVLAFIFQPIRRFFDKLTNRLFYKDNYNIDDFFSRLNRQLTSTTSLKNLMERASTEIQNTLKSEQVYFFVYTTGHYHMLAGTAKHTKLPGQDALLIQELHPENEVLVANVLPHDDPVRRMMVAHRLALIMPLIQDGVPIGYVCLGEHRNSGYTSRDLRVIKTIADELRIAIQNARSILEVKELNANLEQRIDAATKELRASNAQLQKLDEAKDEFISMASHQLRTPLTSIKGYISMMMEGDSGPVTAQQKHILNETFVSSERMVRLIGDFLNVSRLQTGKFVIEKHPVDLAKIVAQEIDALGPNAAGRGLKFVYKQPKVFPSLDLDENKIRQVIMNFADNAIYYSKNNSSIKIELSVTKAGIEFTVKDTGIGVPEDEKAQLFKKFFRATNARKQRPDGTGVGLFLAQKVVQDHGGQIIFESKEGKGSTFGFRLPLPKKSK